jgi:hypothetical protein
MRVAHFSVTYMFNIENASLPPKSPRLTTWVELRGAPERQRRSPNAAQSSALGVGEGSDGLNLCKSSQRKALQTPSAFVRLNNADLPEGIALGSYLPTPYRANLSGNVAQSVPFQESQFHSIGN